MLVLLFFGSYFKYTVRGLPNEEFSVSPKGDLILRKTVDFEVREQYNFSVFISDGRRNDTANIEITLLNINDWDPRFKYPQYEFFVKADDFYKGKFFCDMFIYL